MITHFVRFLFSLFAAGVVDVVIVVVLYMASKYDTDKTAGGAYFALAVIGCAIATVVVFTGMEIYLYRNDVH